MQTFLKTDILELILDPPKPARGRTGQASVWISLVFQLPWQRPFFFSCFYLRSRRKTSISSKQVSPGHSWPRHQTSLPPGFDNQLCFDAPSQQNTPVQQQSTESLPPAPAVTASPQTGTGSFSYRQHQLRACSFPAQTTHISQAGTIIHGACHKGKQIKKLTWDLFVALFVLLLVLFGFSPLIHIKFPDSEFCQHDWGGRQTPASLQSSRTAPERG